MFEAGDKITLEDVVNWCINLDIKCDSGMNQQNSGGTNYMNRIYTKAVSRNVFRLRKSQLNDGSVMTYILHSFAHINLTNAVCVANEKTKENNVSNEVRTHKEKRHLEGWTNGQSGDIINSQL